MSLFRIEKTCCLQIAAQHQLTSPVFGPMIVMGGHAVSWNALLEITVTVQVLAADDFEHVWLLHEQMLAGHLTQAVQN